MIGIIEALAPVTLLIVFGWIARATGLFAAAAIGEVNRFGYFVLYPAFMFHTISGAKLGAADTWTFLGGVALAFVAMAAFTISLRGFFKDGPAFTSVFQGAVRWNGFAILASADAVFGPGARTFVALMFGPAVLAINVMSVAVLARWGSKAEPSRRFLLGQIFGNPLVIACLAGFAAAAVGLPSLGPVTAALDLLGQAAMPVALVCVGAGLDLGAVRRAKAPVAVAIVLKLAVAPLLFYWAARLVGAGPQAAAIAAGIGSTPTAAASYALAREMGGDDRLMAAIITMTTIVSFVSMPIAIMLALGAGG